MAERKTEQKVECACGMRVRPCNYDRHIKGVWHQRYLDTVRRIRAVYSTTGGADDQASEKELTMPEPITKTMYRRKDGQPIADMYGWVDDLEFFDDEYDPIDLVKEVWVLQSSEDIKYPPPCEHIYDEEGECRECGAELEAVAMDAKETDA